jgi:hypothetical protein
MKESAMSIERITTLRGQIADITTELDSITRGALVPLETALERLEGWIAAKGAEVDPAGLRDLTRPRATLHGLMDMLDGQAYRPGHLTSVLCWLLPTQVFERLQAQIITLYAATDQPALGEEDRVASIARLQAELLELETEEEQAIRDMEEAGQQAPVRRGDVHHLEVVLAD